MSSTKLEQLKNELRELEAELKRKRDKEKILEYTSNVLYSPELRRKICVQEVNDFLKGSSYKLLAEDDKVTLQANGNIFTLPVKIDKFAMFADVVALLVTGSPKRSVAFSERGSEHTKLDLYLDHEGIKADIELTISEEDGEVFFDYELVINRFVKEGNNYHLTTANIHFDKRQVGFDVVVGDVRSIFETLLSLEV